MIRNGYRGCVYEGLRTLWKIAWHADFPRKQTGGTGKTKELNGELETGWTRGTGHLEGGDRTEKTLRGQTENGAENKDRQTDRAVLFVATA